MMKSRIVRSTPKAAHAVKMGNSRQRDLLSRTARSPAVAAKDTAHSNLLIAVKCMPPQHTHCRGRLQRPRDDAEEDIAPRGNYIPSRLRMAAITAVPELVVAVLAAVVFEGGGSPSPGPPSAKAEAEKAITAARTTGVRYFFMGLRFPAPSGA